MTIEVNADRHDQYDAIPRCFFVVGAQRSGTTLLRILLDRHSMVAIPPETAGMIPELHAHRDRYGRNGRLEDVAAFVGDLERHPGFRSWGISTDAIRSELGGATTLSQAIEAVYLTYAHLRGKKGWGDKTPQYVEHVQLLAGLFPDARFIHMIRDGRDVAMSELDLHRLHRHAASAAFLWSRKVRIGREAGRALADGRYMELRYEDMLASPDTELARLCRFLGLSYEPTMLSHDPTAIRGTLMSMPVVARAQHQRLLLPPTKGLRDWRNQMAPTDVAQFEAIAGNVLVQTGYPLAEPDTLPIDRLRAWLRVTEFAIRSSGPRLRFRRRKRRRWRETGEERRLVS